MERSLLLATASENACATQPHEAPLLGIEASHPSLCAICTARANTGSGGSELLFEQSE